MTRLDRFRKFVKEVNPKEIIIHSHVVARDYVYSSLYNGERYVLANSYDYEAMLAGLSDKDREALENSFFGIPVHEDAEAAKLALCGVLTCGSTMPLFDTQRPLKSFFPQNPTDDTPW